MFCPSCGSEIESNVSFCPKCGARISAATNLKGNANTQYSDEIAYSNEQAEAAQGENYQAETKEMLFDYHPYGTFLKRSVCSVYINDFYVDVNGNSIDRAHISGTRRDCEWPWFVILSLLFMGLYCFASLYFVVVSIFTLRFLTALRGVLIFLFAGGGFYGLLGFSEHVLIIKGSGSADAIRISVSGAHRQELDPIEAAVKALAASHDYDTNVRVHSAVNRAHSEYQTDRIIDAINRK